MSWTTAVVNVVQFIFKVNYRWLRVQLPFDLSVHIFSPPPPPPPPQVDLKVDLKLSSQIFDLIGSANVSFNPMLQVIKIHSSDYVQINWKSSSKWIHQIELITNRFQSNSIFHYKLIINQKSINLIKYFAKLLFTMNEYDWIMNIFDCKLIINPKFTNLIKYWIDTNSQ